MFVLNDDLSIYATRGDIVFFSVSAEENGKAYTFKAGDVVRIKIYGKKNATSVVLEKDFPVVEDTASVEIFLSSEDTKIGEVINKPKDYWYEVELNPRTNPQTIIGYDEDGAKVFKLFPEGKDLIEYVPDSEDIPFVDAELDLLSPRPPQNQAVTRAILQMEKAVEETQYTVNEKAQNTSHKVGALEQELAVERNRINAITALPSGSTTNDARLEDIRNGADGLTYDSPASAVRGQLKSIAKNYVRVESRNLVNKDNLTYGYYVDYRNGTFVADSGSSYTELIEIKPDTYYTYSMHATNRAVGQLAYYDAEGEYISGVPNSGVKNYITLATPTNAKFVRWTVPVGYVNMVSIAEGTVVIPYEAYYPHIPKKYIEKYVEVGPGREYASILKALKNTHSETTIYIHPGTYMIEAEYKEVYGDTFFDEYEGYTGKADNFLRGLWLGDGRKVIGLGNVELVFGYRGNNAKVNEEFSIIANGVNVLLENVTIRVFGNCRYHIHDDFQPKNGSVTFRNLILDGTPASPVLIGGGLGKDVTYHIDRCVFVNDEDAIYDISYHGSTADDLVIKCKLDVTDCYGNSGCAFRWYGKSTNTSLCKVSGSHFANIECIPYNEEQPNENMKLVAWNNELA